MTACTTLAPLAFRNVESARQIINCGVIECIVGALQQHLNFRLYEVALLLLANLFWHSELPAGDGVMRCLYTLNISIVHWSCSWALMQALCPCETSVLRCLGVFICTG